MTIFETIVKIVRDDTCAIKKKTKKKPFQERSSVSARRKVELTSTLRRAADDRQIFDQ